MSGGVIGAALIGSAVALAACGGAPVSGAQGGARRCRGGAVTDPIALEALAGCATITGDLAIAGAALVELDALSALRELRGDLVIGPTSRLASARGLAHLTRVTGSVSVARNFELGGLYLGSLVAVGGDLRVERNLSLITASLHRLIEVGGDVAITDNGDLERVDLSALTRVGGDLTIRGRDEPVVVMPRSVKIRGRRHVPIETP